MSMRRAALGLLPVPQVLADAIQKKMNEDDKKKAEEGEKPESTEAR